MYAVDVVEAIRGCIFPVRSRLLCSSGTNIFEHDVHQNWRVSKSKLVVDGL